MITTLKDLSWSPQHVLLLKAHKLISNITEDNISSIEQHKYENGHYYYKVNITNMTDQYGEGMDVIITNTQAYDGKHKIEQVGDNYLIIKTYLTPASFPVTSGKIKVSGVINSGKYINYTPVFNNDGYIIGCEYTGSNYFYIDINKDLQSSSTNAIQIINTGNSTINAVVKWSLNGVNWINFDPQITISVAAGASNGVIIKDLPTKLKLLIEVVTTSKYYILAV